MPDIISNHNPLVIGGTGGSGTRAVAKICIALGAQLGERLNTSLDCLDFVQFHNRWIKAVHMLGHRGDTISVPHERFAQELNLILSRLKNDIGLRNTDDRVWGWKAPRSILILPALIAACPQMRFIHVIRDGRDMMFSSNQNQAEKHGIHILGPEAMDMEIEERAIRIWNTVNLRAKHIGQTVLGPNYLCIRFEDLCQTPERTIGKIAQFTGLTIDDPKVLDSLVHAPDTIGRWRKNNDKLNLFAVAEEGLKAFKYI